MKIDSTNMTNLFTGFNGAFKKGFGGAATAYSRIAMTVPSINREETYGWLGQFPKLREWLGPRIIHNLSLSTYTIKNRSFEQTIAVDRDDVEDDKYGVFGPMFEELGRSAAETPDDLVFSLLKAGFQTNCYDGQFFFDTDHPSYGSDGAAVTISNVQTGGGTPWFLFDTSRAVKALIYQERRPFDELIKKDSPGDDNVFFEKEFIYGSDGRGNAGFGLWQLAFGSKQALTSANYGLARASMQKVHSETGRPLGVKPNVMVVGPDLEEAALKLLNSTTLANGESNPWKGTAELIVTPWAA